MAKIGYFLSSEEHSAPNLVQFAVAAEEAGFQGLWISDHFHPWNDAQGQSPFVWSTIGALAQATKRMSVTTAVTCPTIRIHPAIIAQAAATCASLLPERFSLGVGTGEALNEHILGDRWPPLGTRMEMLEEAIEVIRTLWSGDTVTHHGAHYTVENARIYSLPKALPPILVSGFGPVAARLAGRVGEGFCCVKPDRELVAAFEEAGGAGKRKQGGLKVCWGADEAEAKRTAHRLWPNDVLPGQMAQELSMPAHFEQASAIVTETMVADQVVCGNDVDRHVDAIQKYLDAGFDEVYVGQIGTEQQGFFDFYRSEVLPRFR
ncbi:MAG TPA: TIGR03557 family F420-dependent LLM class oxidoreductase [Candidatus Dormibacteraeota bacterium]